MSRFKDRVCLITGGASGLGEGIAHQLLAEGATVEVWDASAESLEAAGTRFVARHFTVVGNRVDVTDESQVSGAMDAIMSRYGRLDVVVNSAGIVGPSSQTVDEVDVADWTRVLLVNLTGSFLVLKHSVRVMKPANFGRVLLIASIAGKEGNPKMSPYSASKAGVIGLVKSAGKELATTNITVNAVAPCTIRTPMVDAMDAGAVAYMKSKIPAGRFGEIEEFSRFVANVVDPCMSGVTAFCYDHSLGRATY